MEIKGLIFDFDGLILDTETPDFVAWQEVYHEHGQVLSMDLWGSIVGGNGAAVFHPLDYLAARLPSGINRDAIKKQQYERHMEAILVQPVLPGVVDILAAAKQLGLKLAVASSSPHSWVDGHLKRLGLLHWFDVVVCAEDVERTKPDPALFVKAGNLLGIQPDQLVVFEDSPNGQKAARSARMFCVIVPNPITTQLQFGPIDLKLKTLADYNVNSLFVKIKSLKTANQG